MNTGTVKRISAPAPARAGMAQMRPPCASIIDRLIDRPNPIPVSFVDAKGWNSRPPISGEMPGPVSRTANSTMRGSAARLAATSISRKGGLAALIASMPLRSRFSKTCSIWIGSAKTGGVPGSTRAAMRT